MQATISSVLLTTEQNAPARVETEGNYLFKIVLESNDFSTALASSLFVIDIVKFMSPGKERQKYQVSFAIIVQKGKSDSINSNRSHFVWKKKRNNFILF